MPKISKAHGPTTGSPDPARTIVAESDPSEPVDETSEAAPAIDQAPETNASTTVDTAEQDGAGSELDPSDAANGASKPGAETLAGKPAVASRSVAKRRATRG